MKQLDVLFISPGNHDEIYQSLADTYSTIETPTWSLLLAQSCRSVGYKVAMLDACAERLTLEEAVQRVSEANPRLICFVVYGPNPNAGTVNMNGAVKLANAIKKAGIKTPIGMIGSYVQALPVKTLQDEKSVDIVFTNEGVYALRNLLQKDLNDTNQWEQVNGIGFRKDNEVHLTPTEAVVPQEKMDTDLPGYAWDLLPYRNKPLDLYRAPMWHAEYKEENRTPYAAIYTSLGCAFKCSFCMINIINRNDNDPVGVASNYSRMRFWSPNFIIQEFDKLVEMGVRTLKISDEMFLLNQKYYVPLCKLLKERGYGKELNMWAYSRIDTIRKPENLQLVREAGIRWLALGIENGDRQIRLQVTKGTFEDVDINAVVRMVHDADIEIIANYLFGLPGDDYESMQNTFNLSQELCTMAWNGYAAMALPGSQLYKDAVEKGYDIPKEYSEFSFHSYNTKPLPTDHLKPAQILKFRDESWVKYHSYLPFLQRVENRYGREARENIENMAKITLKRKIAGE
ncbi:MAG: radical SAM protein [Deltaproteobacteria bacterium]|nr:radical SAM protein [Deltaproteobacteria bacterium]